MTHTDEQIQDLVREMYTTAESTDWQLTAEDVRSHRGRRRVPVPDVKVMILAAAAVVLIVVGIGVARANNPPKTFANGPTTTTSTATPATVTVPTGAVGTTLANAMAILASDGLKVSVEYVSNTSASGTVIGVTPSAGTDVANGSTVNLTVSSGSSASSRPSTVHAPNVVGLTQAAAANELGQAGLNVGYITEVPSTTFSAGAVVSQNPAANSSLSTGASVDLSVSSGP
ncbi:MAG: PASTA domain-containing protein [Acidimicrobiales bacterium]|jgi:serine/threonine-protein kinase